MKHLWVCLSADVVFFKVLKIVFCAKKDIIGWNTKIWLKHIWADLQGLKSHVCVTVNSVHAVILHHICVVQI